MSNKDNHILVLMSTYNGELYLREQLDSILNQKDVDVHLLIRDDGSNDKTALILDDYTKKNKDKISIIYGKNIGVKKSFLKLVSEADENYEYYALADQDDVWLKEKLITGINKLKNEKSNMPLIYGSPVTLYTEGVHGKQYFKEGTNYQFGNFLVKNYFPGCTMIFNKKMKELIDICDYKVLPDKPLHDHWMNLVCTGCGGKIIMDSTSYILYRQHERNVVGERTLLEKIKGNGLLSDENTRYKYAEEFYNVYKNYLTPYSRKDILDVLYYRNSIRKRMALLMNRKIKPKRTIEKFLISLCIIASKF